MRHKETVLSVGVLVFTAALWPLAETKIQASAGAQYDAFGQTVAFDGVLLVTGAHQDGDAAGAAYVYERQGSAWSPETKLIASDRHDHDFFGMDADVSGDHVIVGASGHDPVDAPLSNNSYGGAYFFLRTPNGWVEEALVHASDPQLNSEFGADVAISGDYAVVGARFAEIDGKANQGAAYVFKYENGAWVEKQRLLAPDGIETDEFGNAVDIDGDNIFVGTVDARQGGTGPRVGAVWTYRRDASDTWQFETKLQPRDLEDGFQFGSAVKISGEVAIVGAADGMGREYGTGSAYLFRRSAGGWAQEAKIHASDGSNADSFGHSVTIDGDHAAVGASLAFVNGVFQQGSIYRYERGRRGWSEQGKITASDGGDQDQFGSGVAIHGDLLVVGAMGEVGPTGADQEGAMYVYDR